MGVITKLTGKKKQIFKIGVNNNPNIDENFTLFRKDQSVHNYFFFNKKKITLKLFNIVNVRTPQNK